MDPDECLRELLALAAELVELEVNFDEVDECDVYATKVTRMSELVEALDGWIIKGGFLPGGA